MGRANAAAGVCDRRGAPADGVLQRSTDADGGPAASGGTVAVAVDSGLLARSGVREPAGGRAVPGREGAASVVEADAAGAEGAGSRGAECVGFGGAARGEAEAVGGAREGV